jgi:hypothetical protein
VKVFTKLTKQLAKKAWAQVTFTAAKIAV